MKNCRLSIFLGLIAGLLLAMVICIAIFNYDTNKYHKQMAQDIREIKIILQNLNLTKE